MRYNDEPITENGRIVLTALYEAHEDRDYLTTTELVDRVTLDREAVQHQRKDNLEPAGLIKTENPGVAPGEGQLPLRFRLTEEGREFCEEHADEVLVDNLGETVEDQVQRLRGQIAILSQGELTGDEMDEVWQRMDRLADRQERIHTRMDEIDDRLEAVGRVERRANALLDADLGDLPYVTEEDLVETVDELGREFEDVYSSMEMTVDRKGPAFGGPYLTAMLTEGEVPERADMANADVDTVLEETPRAWDEEMDSRVTKLEEQMNKVRDDMWQIKSDIRGLKDSFDHLMNALEVSNPVADAEQGSGSKGVFDGAVAEDEREASGDVSTTEGLDGTGEDSAAPSEQGGSVPLLSEDKVREIREDLEEDGLVNPDA